MTESLTGSSLHAAPGEHIIDAHAHIFPDLVARKATNAIGDFYEIEMRHSGSSAGLLESGRKIGVSRYLVCSSATTPPQVSSINSYIAQECAAHPEFFGFGTMHPDCSDFQREVDLLLSLGLHGVKLHPDFQDFAIDDEKAIRMYRVLAKNNLPVLFHTGDKRYWRSSPFQLVNALEKVDGLRAIGAHFGGYTEWENSNIYPVTERLRFDTSSTLFALEKEKALALISHFGADKFFFGVDFPMWDHAEELERFNQLGLDIADRRAILSGNFASFFGLTQTGDSVT